jgi:hypothetical protein
LVGMEGLLVSCHQVSPGVTSFAISAKVWLLFRVTSLMSHAMLSSPEALLANLAHVGPSRFLSASRLLLTIGPLHIVVVEGKNTMGTI